MTRLCECGCGDMAPLSKYTTRCGNYNYVKGEPLRFIPGHQARGRTWSDEQRKSFRATMLGHPVTAETRNKISERHKELGTRPPPEAVDLANLNRGRREHSPSWKGGTSIVNGYRCVYQPDHPRRHPNGYVYEHITIAEATIGRRLNAGEVVHHLDHNKLNNHPDNLVVVESSPMHMRLYHPKVKIPRSS